MLAGIFLVYIGFDLGRQIYVDDGNPLFYIPSVIFMVLGGSFCIYYYRQHKRDKDGEDGE